MSVEEYVKTMLRQEITDLLAMQCTEEERAGFQRIFPEGMEKLSEVTLRQALALVYRTIRGRK